MYNAKISVSLDRQGLRAPDTSSRQDIRIRFLQVSQSEQGCVHQAATSPGIRITRVPWYCRCATAPQTLHTLTFKRPWLLDSVTSLSLWPQPSPQLGRSVLTKLVDGRDCSGKCVSSDKMPVPSWSSMVPTVRESRRCHLLSYTCNTFGWSAKSGRFLRKQALRFKNIWIQEGAFLVK